MGHSSLCLAVVLGLLAPVAAWTADKALETRPCLDYWAVGQSGKCAEPKPEPKPEPVQPPPPPSPTAVQAPPPAPVSPTLDKKIDEFIANHGKPPREFVAFYLDPTPENAVAWVAKYNEMLQRGQDIALAWTQAETLYSNAISQGVSPAALNPNAFAPVPDYGVPVPGFNTPAFTQLVSGSNVAANPVVPAQINQPLPPAAQPQTVNTPSGLIKPVDPVNQSFTGKPIEVSYYFSAVCPYCKKFEPGFAQVISQVKDRVKLTCVDVTPEVGAYLKTPDNIGARLPCTWRPATAEELTRLGVRQTPSLVVNRGDDKPLELVSGYVEPEMLKNYFVAASTGR